MRWYCKVGVALYHSPAIQSRPKAQSGRPKKLKAACLLSRSSHIMQSAYLVEWVPHDFCKSVGWILYDSCRSSGWMPSEFYLKSDGALNEFCMISE